MRIITKSLARIAILALLMVARAWAAPVLTYNTGVDNAGTVQANGSTETHYTLVASGYAALPAGSPLIAYTSAAGFPIPPWLGDNTSSRWIAPRNGAVDGFKGTGVSHAGNVTFTYQTTFSLVGFNAASAVLTGNFSADNSAVAFLNGNNIGSAGSFDSFFAFGTSNPAFFTAGTNTLRFVVTNFAGNTNPTGLRVQYGVTANAVPEINPDSASLPLAILALMFVLLTDRRRQAQ